MTVIAPWPETVDEQRAKQRVVILDEIHMLVMRFFDTGNCRFIRDGQDIAAKCLDPDDAVEICKLLDDQVTYADAFGHFIYEG